MRAASESSLRLTPAVLAEGVVLAIAFAPPASSAGTTHPSRTSLAPGSLNSNLRLGARSPDRSLHRAEPTPVPQPAPRPLSDR
jgi:hypothetical protein